jgi:hypothetical protein
MKDRIETAGKLAEQYNNGAIELSEDDRKRLRQELVYVCARLAGRSIAVNIVAYPWRDTYYAGLDPETERPRYRSIDTRATEPVEFPNNVIKAVDGATERVFIHPYPAISDSGQLAWHEVLVGNIVSISEPEIQNIDNELGEAS